MEITHKQLTLFGQIFGDRTGDIEAMIGRKLTNEERIIVKRASGSKKIARALDKAKKVQADNDGEPMTGSEKVAAHRSRHNLIKRRKCKNPERRALMEADPMAWLKCYMPNTFKLEWAAGHKETVEAAVLTAKSGQGVAVALARGEGKSAILRGVAFYLHVTGVIKFPVVAPWTGRNAKIHFKSWLQMLKSKRSTFAEDYPEYTQPFEISTNSAKLKNLVWADTGEPIGAEVDSIDKLITLPDALGVIAAASVNGDFKGTQVTLINGDVIRPDLLLLDDAQDPKRADNTEYVRDTVESIETEWFGLAGPDVKLTVFVACTVKHQNDVSEYWLKHPDFKAIRIPRVQSFPDGFEEHGHACERHWDEFDNIRRSEGRQEAITYYEENKEVMTKGMSVSWVDRFDAKKGEPDALFSAMWDYYRIGRHSFFSEYQNSPLKRGVDVYTLAPEIVLSRKSDRRAFEVPEWSELIVCGTDINPSYALSTVVTAFGKDRTAAILWYGKYTNAPLPTNDEMSDTQKQQIIFGALWKHGEQLLAYPAKGRQWGIDGGGAQSTVAKRFAYEWNRKHPEMMVVVTYGRSGKSARISARNETIRRRGTDGSWILCRDKDPVYGSTEWVLWNSDYWREIMQRAFTCETGAMGGITLPQGSHHEIAEHICREKLRGKVELNGRMIYDFEKSAGKNDLSDALNICYLIADMQGIGTESVKQKAAPRVAPVFRPSSRR